MRAPRFLGKDVFALGMGLFPRSSVKPRYHASDTVPRPEKMTAAGFRKGDHNQSTRQLDPIGICNGAELRGNGWMAVS
jgi:hypothetical protein